MTAKRAFYLPELDVVRACAFLAVFVTHWVPAHPEDYERHGFSHLLSRALASVPRAGGVGVMLFFCLSSYLITQLLVRELATEGQVRVGAFYMRRALRIWPLYLLFTALAALLPFIDSEQHFGSKSLTAFLLFGGNWIWSLHIPVNTIATPLWSISVEEQFYLCWPWVVRRAKRSSLRRIALVLLLLALSNRVLVVAGVIPTDLWHSTFTQLDSIALGALLALGLGEWGDALRRRYRARILLAAVATIVLAQFFEGDPGSQPFSLVYFPLASLACAVILWSVLGVEIDRSSPLMRLFVYFGKISYGLYVFHSLGLYLVDKGFDVLPAKPNFIVGLALRGVVALLLTVVLASLSFRFIEQPFLRLKKHFD